ncbi:flagellar hook-basal body protein [Tuberibacillus sp. Marseille-P3662]|uniref:flagellar hook-basal body protein n=1 Tax=Tuberibacillus sp. Marseille-P3662 TaxID=1965358 RepID=UPI000A1C9CDC|nr:flagellar hook-basal body protein [Tuberibacillus sp. Marseille-P3662]
MFRGFYTAASGMMTQSRRTDVLTNNIANKNTPGYKADQTATKSFPNYLIERLQKGNSENLGRLSSGAYVQETVPDFTSGSLKETNRSTDLALMGNNIPGDADTGRPGAVFFTVEGSDGNRRYTRNGQLTLDGTGQLTTAKGQPVLGTNGQPIQLASQNFNVDASGRVFEEGQFTGRQVQVAYAANPYDLVKDGSGLYHLEGDGLLPQANNNDNISFNIKQGFLEQSNVALEESMTNLSNSYRLFEANQKILKAYDRSMQLAATKVGRLG